MVKKLFTKKRRKVDLVKSCEVSAPHSTFRPLKTKLCCRIVNDFSHFHEIPIQSLDVGILLLGSSNVGIGDLEVFGGFPF